MPGFLGIVSFAVTWAALQVLLWRFSRLALDKPNERSLHETPVPRTGGIAMLLGVATSIASASGAPTLALAIAVLLAGVSFIDDMRSLPIGVRLLAHLVAASVLVWYVLSPMHPIELALVAIAVVWISNLYNFMDGSDGLAGGMALIGFSAYGLAADTAGHIPLFAMSISVVGASAAFITLNFHPARIFLGDVGSVPIGFLAAALGVIGWRDDVWPIWFPLLVFAPFIGDATVTLLKRLVRQEKIWKAHRDHYYQRLIRLGCGHRGTAVGSYALMLVCAAAALIGRNAAPATQLAAFSAVSMVLLAVGVWIDVRWARRADARKVRR